MMLSMDIDVHDIRSREIHLFSRSNSPAGPQTGDPMLLVHVLDLGLPKLARDFETVPAIRLETFEKRDTFNDTHALYKQGGGRSFGLDRRLVVPSRSVEPNFKVMLLPYRFGDELPVIEYDTNNRTAVLQWGLTEERIRSAKQPNGLSIEIDGHPAVTL